MFTKILAGILLASSLQVYASPVAPRNNNFLSELIAFLRTNDLGSYASQLSDYGGTNEGKTFVERLQYGKRTLYVASNKALGSNPRVRQTGSAQPMAFSATDDGSNPGKRNNNQARRRLVQPTLWDDPNFVNLGGRPQVQVIDFSSDGEPVIRGTTTNSPGRTIGTFRNIYVKEISTKITPPLSVGDTLWESLVEEAPNGFPDFGKEAQNAGILADLNNKGSTTLFVPISLPSEGVSRNELENHILWNNVLYSPDILDKDTTIAASGNTLNFRVEGDQLYVIYKDVKSRVIRSDVTTNNGVVHVIEKALLG